MARLTISTGRAIETIGEALAGSDRPLVIASGLAGLAPGEVATEEDAGDPNAPVSPRLASEVAIGAMAQWRSGACAHPACDSLRPFWRWRSRLPRDGDRDRAREGVSGYVGDGTNRWPGVYRFDAARLFVLGLERAPAGSTLHAAAEEGVPVARNRRRDRAPSRPPGGVDLTRAGRRALRLPGRLPRGDIPASSALTRERLGWEPTHPGLIEDLDQGHYFAAPTT